MRLRLDTSFSLSAWLRAVLGSNRVRVARRERFSLPRAPARRTHASRSNQPAAGLEIDERSEWSRSSGLDIRRRRRSCRVRGRVEGQDSFEFHLRYGGGARAPVRVGIEIDSEAPLPCAAAQKHIARDHETPCPFPFVCVRWYSRSPRCCRSIPSSRKTWTARARRTTSRSRACAASNGAR